MIRVIIILGLFSLAFAKVNESPQIRQNNFAFVHPIIVGLGGGVILTYERKIVDYVSILVNGELRPQNGRGAKFGTRVYPFSARMFYVEADIAYNKMNEKDTIDYLYNNRLLTSYTSAGLLIGVKARVYKRLIYFFEVGSFKMLTKATKSSNEKLYSTNWIGDPSMFLSYNSIEMSFGVGMGF